MEDIRKLGFVVNPTAGLGGKVGLKGTDGDDIVKKALEMGAKPVASERARECLTNLLPIKHEIQLITYPHEMGEDEAKKTGFEPKVLGKISSGKTSRIDTIRALKDMHNEKAELVLFVGGDGTARDVLNAVNMKLPVLGVPSGVKTFSGVFAINPKVAATIAKEYLNGQLSLKEAEVVDIDEEDFRSGRLSVRTYGYLQMPYEPNFVQIVKGATVIENEKDNQNAIASYIIEEMQPDVLYIVGPGTTTKQITDHLGLEKTLLGVDIIVNKKMLVKDANERNLLKAIEGKVARLVVSPTGQQGFIFGRGNQQISGEIIRRIGKKNTIILATKQKLRKIKVLHVDTGDPQADVLFRGYVRVVSDYKEETMIKVD